MSTYLAIAKRGYVPLVNEDEEVVPGNIGALKKGLQALLREDAEDDERAAVKWAQGEELLAKESENESVAAQGVVQVVDDFYMSALGEE